MQVRKRDGKVEDFIREKIVVAIVKAGGRADLARAVAQEVETTLSRNSSVTTDQIRTEVFNRLQNRDSKTYSSWIEYDRQTKNKM